MTKRILFVFAPAGPPIDYAMPKIAAKAEITTYILYPPPEYNLNVIQQYSASVHDISNLPLNEALNTLDELVADGSFDGIFTFSEFLLMSISKIAKTNNLRGVGENVYKARNKVTMRECWDNVGVPQPKFAHVSNSENAEQACANLELPFVLKSAYGAGSIGLQVVSELSNFNMQLSELVRAVEQARQQGKHEFEEQDDFPSIIAEEMIVASTEPWYETNKYGNFVSIEGLVVDGVYKPLAMTGRFPTIEPFTELGNIAPSVMSGENKSNILDVVTTAIDALELENCATHTELKLLPNGTVNLLETAARMGGVAIAQELDVAFGLDYVGLYIDTLLGTTENIPSFEQNPTGNSAASLALIATDSTGKPWKSKRRFCDIDWSELLVGETTTAHVITSQSMPFDNDFPEYDLAGGVMNYAGQLFIKAETPENLLNSAYSVLDQLEYKLPDA